MNKGGSFNLNFEICAFKEIMHNILIWMGGKIKPILMVINMLICKDSIHDCNLLVTYLFVNYLIIIGGGKIKPLR